jgi:hypothetical protein
MHRWIWDLHYPPIAAADRDFPIAAIPHDTPLEPLGPRAVPGQYSVKLTVNGQNYTQPLTLKMDPRVHATEADLQAQFEMESKIAADLQKNSEALQQAKSASAQMQGASGPNQALAKELAELIAVRSGMERAQYEENSGPDTLSSVNERLAAIYTSIDSADAAPTAEAQKELTVTEGQLNSALSSWEQIKAKIPGAR